MVLISGDRDLEMLARYEESRLTVIFWRQFWMIVSPGRFGQTTTETESPQRRPVPTVRGRAPSICAESSHISMLHIKEIDYAYPLILSELQC